MQEEEQEHFTCSLEKNSMLENKVRQEILQISRRQQWSFSPLVRNYLLSTYSGPDTQLDNGDRMEQDKVSAFKKLYVLVGRKPLNKEKHMYKEANLSTRKYGKKIERGNMK